jgi:hypothetical protein
LPADLGSADGSGVTTLINCMKREYKAGAIAQL